MYVYSDPESIVTLSFTHVQTKTRFRLYWLDNFVLLETLGMTKSMITLIIATLFLTGCATMQGTVDQACGSVVLSWLCG